jgi:hypothetical protein
VTDLGESDATGSKGVSDIAIRSTAREQLMETS